MHSTNLSKINNQVVDAKPNKVSGTKFVSIVMVTL